MAKSNSFSKREIEKNKQKRREEKRKRREERKNNPSDSFEDMIAYVDEFGVISSTPPEPIDEDEEIEIEDIEISTPKMEVVEVESVMEGRVDFFNHGKGFGFIKPLNKQDSYFFHITNAYAEIDEGDIVSFELERGDRGFNAINVQKATN